MNQLKEDIGKIIIIKKKTRHADRWLLNWTGVLLESYRQKSETIKWQTLIWRFGKFDNIDLMLMNLFTWQTDSNEWSAIKSHLYALFSVMLEQRVSAISLNLNQTRTKALKMWSQAWSLYGKPLEKIDMVTYRVPCAGEIPTVGVKQMELRLIPMFHFGNWSNLLTDTEIQEKQSHVLTYRQNKHPRESTHKAIMQTTTHIPAK